MARPRHLYVSQGETRAITDTLRHPQTDEVLDLTGCTVTFYLIDTQFWLGQKFSPPYPGETVVLDTDALKVDGASVTITGATSGAVSYSPAAEDFDTPGTYFRQYKVVDGSSKVTLTPRIDLSNGLEECPLLFVAPGLPEFS